jgi:choline dehydrogenase-like flavoprotein
MNFNSKGKDEVSYDAIVIGSGISGGWAMKELTEKGLKTLLLERGRMVRHGEYPTANLEDWELPNRNKMTKEGLKDYPVQSRTGYTIEPSLLHWWVKDNEYPYEEKKPFDWIRGYHMGGRSLLWGRQSYRWSDIDFELNAKEGIAVDWPIRYKDIAPWYDYVETFAGISGQNEGLRELPDGKFLPPMEFNCIEKHVKKRIEAAFPGRVMTIGRTAHLTQPLAGRGTCQSRNKCMRGCPYGAYFSTLASTMPAAEKTQNLTIRPYSLVTEIIYDPESGKASSVIVKDTETGEHHEFFAKIIFCNASTLNTTRILMNSKSDRFPNGLGNDSGELGHNIMDHHFRCGANGDSDMFQDEYYVGSRPNGIYIPRFQNNDAQTKRKNYLGGFGYQGGGSREKWWRVIKEADFGAAFKAAIREPGLWKMGLMGFGECLAYHDNKVSLNYEKLDKDGQPTFVLDCEWKENEAEMRKEMMTAAAEMLEAAGIKNVETYDSGCNPGLGIHEMGTARMGIDPKTSVLNKWNQIHGVPNVFVTDGACMTSSAAVNPSLTYMALTARAAHYAVDQLNRNNL